MTKQTCKNKIILLKRESNEQLNQTKLKDFDHEVETKKAKDSLYHSLKEEKKKK